MRIVYTGQLHGTCLQRATAIAGLGVDISLVESGPPRRSLSRQLYRIGRRLGLAPDTQRAGRRILAAVRKTGADVLWIDKGITISPGTLEAVRGCSPGTVLVHYSPDDMFNPDNQSGRYLRGIPLYDLHVTTKSYNVAELEAAGARRVLFVNNAYDPATHRPLMLTPAETQRFGCDVGFVGSFEEERALMLLGLAREGVRIRVWGEAWEGLRGDHPNLDVRREYLDGPEYAKAVNATRINLGFLRKANRDLQTTRSVEIPACGAFLLAERTAEHLDLFREGEEAEFFEGPAELLEKILYYLAHEDRRKAVALAGLERCRRSGYSNSETLRPVVEIARGIRSG